MVENIDLKRVGFAGLGIMGDPLSRRLLDRAHSLLVWKPNAREGGVAGA